ncbi:polygalacturonase non-catalytic subunit AroGP2-like [Telopea speciosissima]|uniref:polygalacturonase non-catalytic subunit AroGP2-like n=1 Tax=Telopea speciosissima TaxID=54955 RepID=UPI001CC41EC8|nr:polygalacturonase non-catalytic subunit AroGP2-like [Telopea speciosissima]
MRYPYLLLGILIIAHLSGSLAENTFSQYWKEHIDLPQPPYWFIAKVSPLNPHQVSMFMKLMEENKLASHLPSFCKQANVACSTNALTTLPPKVHWTDGILKYELPIPSENPLWVASQGGLPYFRESMVKEGGFMDVPDLRDPMSYKSFLPRSLASKIPFSSARIKELKKLFGVVDESNMDEYIQDTLQICEKNPIRGEQCTCVTSAEDLIDFIVEKLGHHVRVWSTENAEGSHENVTIGAVKLIYGNLFEPPALCHSKPLSFQVYYCHVLQKVKIYAVDIHAQKKLNHAIMACHYDTSNWNQNHLAFMLLGFGPGLIEVCHWISENGVVWTKNQGGDT